MTINCICLGAISALAQLQSDSPYRIQFDIGIGRTFHYNPPAIFDHCIEGCIKDQEARSGIGLEMSVYRQISERSEIKVGVGYNQYNFFERITEFIVLTPYERLHKYHFVTFSVGHRLLLSRSGRIRPYLENSFVLDILTRKDPNIRRVNYAYKLDAGVLIDVNNETYLNINAFFKTATDKYNDLSSVGKYSPYSYGIEFGLGKKSFSLR